RQSSHRDALHRLRLRAPSAHAAERACEHPRATPTARRLPRSAVRRPGHGDAGLPELPSLHPPPDTRRALTLRTSRRPRNAHSGMEAQRLGLRRAPSARPGAPVSRPTPPFRTEEKSDQTGVFVADAGTPARAIPNPGATRLRGWR